MSARASMTINSWQDWLSRMWIAQLSDLHIGRQNQLNYGNVNSSAALDEVIAAVNVLSPRPSAVLGTGDLTQSGEVVSTRT